MKNSMRVFIISPVRNVSSETLKKIKAYVALLKSQGFLVHWPYRDTKQDDPTGGYAICKTNFDRIMRWAGSIHIWYDETSGGSEFDMGGTFMIVEMLGWNKRIVIANEDEIPDEVKERKKSFYKVFKRLQGKFERFNAGTE